MTDTNIRYFEAISENKKKDLELRNLESKIDDLQKRMLTRYWKDKISVFDEMIRLNVKTPSYDAERVKKGDGVPEDEAQSMSMGPMTIDSKLLSNRPVTLQKGKKGSGRIEPVINIEGTDAVCYPNKEAKRGRKVGLNQGILRRLEQCKVVEENIASIRCKSARRRTEGVDSQTILGNTSSAKQRPKTAPGGINNKNKTQDTSAPELQTPVTATERRPSTSNGSYKPGVFITSPTEGLKRSVSSASARSRGGRITVR